jgi:fucose 4-O-acetylase-like acetyltransferase
MIARNNIIDSLKGFAILLMVFGHLIQFTSISNLYLTNPIYIFIYSFHMPLFMVISGFFYNKSLKHGSLEKVLKNRIVTVLLPYFSWATIFLIIWFISVGHNLLFVQLLQKYFDVFLFVSKLWFLWVLFICILLMSLNIFIQKYIGVISIIFVALFVYFLPATPILSCTNIKYMFPFFIAGYYYKEYSCVFKEFIYYISYISLLVYPIMLFYWQDENFSFVIHTENLFPIIYKYITGFSGILVIVLIFKKIHNYNDLNYLQKAGRNSIAIYIISDYFVEVISHFKSFFNYNFVFNSFIFLFLTLLITKICLVSEKLLKKSKFLSFILFGKR